MNLTIRQKQSLYIILAISVLGTLGSLFFSEILKFAPCSLCWYQRIALYPMIVISALGIILNDRNSYKYIFLFPVFGMFTAIFHNLLYLGAIPESFSPCINGVSCVTKYFEFGFITLPFLSLVAFTITVICLAVFKRNNN